MWLYLIELLRADEIILADERLLKDFGNECEPKKTENTKRLKNHTLVSLTAIFRHGHRAPLDEKDGAWEEKKCVECNTESCQDISCRGGSLTAWGYQQAKDLGEYIKRNYSGFIKNFEKVGYYSKIKRTLATLHGVLEGMAVNPNSIDLFEEDSIINNKNSTILKNVLSDYEINDSYSFKNDYKFYDRIISSICTKTPYECSDLNCDVKEIFKYLKNRETLFLKNLEKTRKRCDANGISFGDFGLFMEKIISENDKLVLVSGHDSTLVKLLTGLNIKIKRIPPYSSVVLIEKYQREDKYYIRVLHDGYVKKIGLECKEVFEFNDFKGYIELFNNTNKKLPNFKRAFIDEEENIEKAVEKIKKAYKPINKKWDSYNLRDYLNSKESGLFTSLR